MPNISSNDSALLAFCVLTRLGGGKVETFEQRLKSQKFQYLAQLFKVSPPYSFGPYLRGPYSSALARDWFEINRKDIKVQDDKFVPDELETRFIKLKKFVEGKLIRELELITTWNWLLRVAHLTEIEAKKKIIELKNASPDEVVSITKLSKDLP